MQWSASLRTETERLEGVKISPGRRTSKCKGCLEWGWRGQEQLKPDHTGL